MQPPVDFKSAGGFYLIVYAIITILGTARTQGCVKNAIMPLP
jgi:hypothetical protein